MIVHSRFLSSLATVQRTRMLPVPGTVLRRVGERVMADTVVAQAEQHMGYRLLDLQSMLGKPVSDARRVLVKKRGEVVTAGEVLARTGGLFKAECTSPVTGTVLDARGSKVLIEVSPQRVELAAVYPGTVVRLIPDRGVVIEVSGAVVQGVWGTGKPVYARIQTVAPDGETPLRAEQITMSQMGMVLLGGRTLDLACIEQAVQVKVAGFIVGSVSGELIPALEASSLSVLVTEGVGSLGMGGRTFELLAAYDGREVCLNPQADLPEVVAPLPNDQRVKGSEDTHVLRVGSRVRAVRAPYQALTGEVVSLPSYKRRIESGILTRGAWVDLEIVGRAFVPLDNLEVII